MTGSARCGTVWDGVGRCRTVWGGVGRCGAVWDGDGREGDAIRIGIFTVLFCSFNYLI